MQERRKTILVVEDDQELREFLVEALELEHTVFSAPDGLAGVAAAREHGPDLILCDYNMPIRNGLYTIAAVRRDPVLAETPIILRSGQAQPEDSGHLLVSFLAKPFPIDRLLQTIHDSLDPHAAVA